MAGARGLASAASPSSASTSIPTTSATSVPSSTQSTSSQTQPTSSQTQPTASPAASSTTQPPASSSASSTAAASSGAGGVSLPLLAFNDVYRVHQRYVPQPGCPEPPSAFPHDAEIRVGQFAQLVYELRAQWPPRKKSAEEGGSDDDGRDGLFLFAGDVFSPSVESSVTRGSHMVPVLNAIKVDAACVGNHDFDFGYPHMTKLVGATKFPWLLSNVVDDRTGRTPAPLHRFVVEERCGVKVGLVGLVEEDWIATIPSWPSHFRYRPMREVGLELSKLLRDPAGPYRVDIIIALTHSRVPNDIKLANELGAVNRPEEIRNTHGVDLIIGGHDHIYYIGKGATSWDGFPGHRDKPGTQDDHGCMIIKSGTDFRDLSSATLNLSPPDDNAIRRRVIDTMTGKHHYVVPSSPTSPAVDKLMDKLLSSVTKTLSQPVCFSITPFDARSEVVRTRESSLGNWTADVLLHAYDESLVDKKIVITKNPDHDSKLTISSGADACIICGGTLRGDSQYGPGKIGLGDILEIFPFDDAVVCLEIDGEGIWQTIESGLSRWPAQEGRFPIVSGLAVQWDSSAPPMQRVKSIHLTLPSSGEDMEDPVEFVDTADGTRLEVRRARLRLGEEVKNEKGGRVYRVITRQYMADGFDGFEALTGRKFLVDHETGTSISNIIRSFLLGSAYIMRKKQLVEDADHAEAAEHATSPSTGTPMAPITPVKSKGHGAKCDLTDAVGPDGVSPANGAYFGTKTPLVLKKHRERAARTSPVVSPRASMAGKDRQSGGKRKQKRKPAHEMNTHAMQRAGLVDIAVEKPGHMPGGAYNVRTGEEDVYSSLVEVKEVELPTKAALLDAAALPEEPGKMPGGTENVIEPGAERSESTGVITKSSDTTKGDAIVENQVSAGSEITSRNDVADIAARKTIAESQAAPAEQDDAEEGTTESEEGEYEAEDYYRQHHVVQHDWDFIKEAIYLAKHEHMSDVDRFKGDLMRMIQAGSVSATPTPSTRTSTPAPVASSVTSVTSGASDAGAVGASGAGASGLSKAGKDGDAAAGPGAVGAAAGKSATTAAKALAAGAAGGPGQDEGVGMACDDACKVEIAGLDNDLAIVSPLVDGRMKDITGAAEA